MYDLTAIGDIKLDVFIDLGSDANVLCNLDKDECEMQIRYGEKIPVDSAVTMMAGSAPNVAIGGRRLGITSTLVSVVGEDTTATLAMQSLKKEGISTEHVTIAKGEQSSFSAVLNYQGESTILAVHRPHIYALPDTLKTSWFFVTELGPTYADLFRELAQRARSGTFVGMNPGTLQIEQRDESLFELISVCELLIVNKNEAQELTGSPSGEPEALLHALQSLGPKRVIVTGGKKGAWALDTSTIYHAPMFPGERVEATGAGDAFSTGVLAALIHGKPLQEALGWGSANAASVVQFVGPQEGLLTQTALESNLAGNAHYQVVTQ